MNENELEDNAQSNEGEDMPMEINEKTTSIPARTSEIPDFVKGVEREARRSTERPGGRRRRRRGGVPDGVRDTADEDIIDGVVDGGRRGESQKTIDAVDGAEGREFRNELRQWGKRCTREWRLHAAIEKFLAGTSSAPPSKNKGDLHRKKEKGKCQL
ncbi:hypothetical protein L484_008738 [Morus notabilis]|uniref:Uncharacterized protein n=1 Tax=Morus notabilis TaxID=981085 RepID=W9RLK1_9ROSA|nr:uncharacterized protein LOC21392095 [Morus notabilis]XP_024020575.1 uncharacterized protein LOC21392095 [Morus notabilis]EXB58584.1 hypothetical protein L484_008738 [Morus notabilis]